MGGTGTDADGCSLHPPHLLGFHTAFLCLALDSSPPPPTELLLPLCSHSLLPFPSRPPSSLKQALLPPLPPPPCRPHTHWVLERDKNQEAGGRPACRGSGHVIGSSVSRWRSDFRTLVPRRSRPGTHFLLLLLLLMATIRVSSVLTSPSAWYRAGLAPSPF